ncbi:MAG: ATP-binding cassette domain-containing protein [Acidimicrobiia bacterium]|nr:ATP-binding cassette domain-containing protein [Acidimicrobiia bacterium]
MSSTTPIVSAADVVKTFGDIVALDGVSLEFDQGIVYALLGPNGAGKTTIIRVLTTLLRPDSGTASVAGVDVLADPKTARTRLGLAGQFAAVDDYLTGRENVEMVGRLYGMTSANARRRAGEVLEKIDLSEAADRNVRTYSGGMRRRLDLAASMVGRPQVLFLDEPTTGVDPRSRLDIWALIKELIDAGTTILLTTQYLDEADQIADRIGVIDRGKLVADGTANELKAKLGGDVIDLHLQADDCAAGLRVVAEIAGEDPSFDADLNMLTIPARDGVNTLMETARRLDENQIVPLDIALRKPTLDEVFMAYTGHTAEEVAKAPKNGGRGRRGRRTE